MSLYYLHLVNTGGCLVVQTRSQGIVNSHVEAEVLSEVFMVFSAKKFPGMTESTELSKCFAKQGIKIPIRKDRFQQSTDSLYRSQGGAEQGSRNAPNMTSSAATQDGAAEDKNDDNDDDDEGIEND
ncbi:velvet factor-domain-containing protein [Endogone sp. FLAS-F59071]|nr:velvet factor-domain-containing protein [Endogone sp. FLAS-F59071]|eukprot:RUS18377.1 velvet factor-domain-containing protein [Endogone sp. FLAS-F59071]